MANVEAASRILVIDNAMSVRAELCTVLANARTSHTACAQRSRGEARLLSHITELEFDSADHSEQSVELVLAARRGERPYSIAFVDVETMPNSTAATSVHALLAADEELQIVLCTIQAADALEAMLCQFAATGRVTVLRKPLGTFETWSLTVSLIDKWRLTRDMNGRLQRQGEQIDSTRRVMAIIEGCLDELEHTHDELHAHASRLTKRLKQRQEEIVGTRDLTMFALAQLADSRDPETGEHLLRMRAYSRLLAEHLSHYGPYERDIDREFLADFYRSTPLHDIGKVGIPDQILLKPGPLTYEEFEIMKRHTVIGAEALEKAAKQSSFGGFLKMAATIARSHHEKFDGTGYPDGLRGQEIPLCARITAVADVFDALTSARVYKAAMPCEQACELIISQSVSHFDPAIVDAFIACYDEFLKVKATVDAGHIEHVTRGNYSPLTIPLVEQDLLFGNLSLMPAL